MRNFRLASVSLVMIGLLTPSVIAQTSRGTVTGIITDASAAGVPGASVELKSKQTGVSRSTTSNESGLYRFDAVDLGEYDLTAKASGFRTITNRSVTVQAAQTIGLDIRLEVGDNVSSVEVSAESI